MKLSGPGLLFAGRFLITVSISVFVMGLLRVSISSWFSFGKLYFSKNFPFLPICPFYWYRVANSSLLLMLLLSCLSCPTVCDPKHGSPPGSPIPGILQARTLEWVAISFSKAWKWKVKLESLSCVWLLVTPWTAAYQTLPSTGFSRQEYCSGVPLPSPSSLLWSFVLLCCLLWFLHFHF